MLFFQATRKNAVFTIAAVFSLLVSSAQADEISACANETLAVQTEGVMAAIQDTIDGTLETTDPATCSSGSGTLSCSIDFGAISENLKSECEAAGGQYVGNSFTLTCDVKASNGTTYQVTYAIANSPDCVGESCDAADLETQEETAINSMADTLEQTSDAITNCAVEQVSSALPIFGAKSFFVLFSAIVTLTALI